MMSMRADKVKATNIRVRLERADSYRQDAQISLLKVCA